MVFPGSKHLLPKSVKLLKWVPNVAVKLATPNASFHSLCPGMVQWMCQPISAATEIWRIRCQHFPLEAIETSADAATAAATGLLESRGHRKSNSDIMLEITRYHSCDTLCELMTAELRYFDGGLQGASGFFAILKNGA